MADPAVIHSKLSFSGRHRWRKCAASVRLSLGLPDKSGPAAEEGTLAHKVKEWVMGVNNGALNLDIIKRPAGLDVPDVAKWRADLLKHARAYATFVTTLVAGAPDAHVSEEQAVDARSIHAALFGTADTLIYIPSLRKLIVIDYKYGFAPVEIGTVEDSNPQLAAYGVAGAERLAASGLQVDEIVLAVYQPRVPLRDPAQVLHIPNAAEWLFNERLKLGQEARATEDPNAPIVPGDHCRYCKAAAHGVCPTVKQYTAAALNVAAGNVALLDIPTDELLALYSARSAFKPFLEEIEERIGQLAKVGHARITVSEVQGRKMWADPKSAAMTLLALGRADLVQPVALSDALPALPADVADSLVKRSASSQRIKIVDAPHVKEVAKIFDKYAKGA